MVIDGAVKTEPQLRNDDFKGILKPYHMGAAGAPKLKALLSEDDFKGILKLNSMHCFNCGKTSLFR